MDSRRDAGKVEAKAKAKAAVRVVEDKAVEVKVVAAIKAAATAFSRA